jgi:hypothetical protein
MVKVLLSKNTFMLVLIGIAVIVGYNIIFAGEETTAEMCIKVADTTFKEIHGRVPSRDDFVDETIIQKDWYPVFEKCLDENQ